MRITFLCLSLISYQSIAQKQLKTIMKKERVFVVQFLKETESDVFKSVKGLTEAQLNFKPAPEKWSVADCVKHIAAAEKELWVMAQETLKQQENPEKRAEIKFGDEDLIKAVENRGHKTKTFAALEPANSPYKTGAEALIGFKADRERLISFVETTQVDLRNHVLILPLGTYDVYQFILLISAHTNRHIQQIEEVKAMISFPKL